MITQRLTHSSHRLSDESLLNKKKKKKKKAKPTGTIIFRSAVDLIFIFIFISLD